MKDGDAIRAEVKKEYAEVVDALKAQHKRAMDDMQKQHFAETEAMVGNRGHGCRAAAAQKTG